jgi:ribosomal protein S12
MLDVQVSAFLEEGLSTYIASRNARLEPNAARVAALRIDADGQHVTAYVPRAGAHLVLPDLQANGQVALVCARPPDERGCQVKGVFVGAWEAPEDDRALVTAQWERFRDKLEGIGLPRQATDGWAPWPCTAIRLRVQAVFDQTPGPGAGARVS